MYNFSVGTVLESFKLPFEKSCEKTLEMKLKTVNWSNGQKELWN